MSMKTAGHPTLDTASDPRWESVLRRDKRADGAFYYSVRTTGVYCKPSCGARRAHPENVQFFITPAEAEKAGFRPCKRCKPDSAIDQAVANVEKVCRFIQISEATPRLQTLAKMAGMSPFHFHRSFKAVTGVTPAAYVRSHRNQRVRMSLEKSANVTEAIYDAGFSSSSRFYEHSDNVLGMTPQRYRAGGSQIRIHFAIAQSSLGSVLVAQSDKGVCAILLGDDPERLVKDLQDQFPAADLVGGDPMYEALVAQVLALLEDPGRATQLPLDIRGSVFQQKVWRALQEIPPGTTSTYAEIAQKIGMPNAVRAVARACGANSLAVAIPCHRVIRTDGKFSGYRWGVERKRVLLEQEAHAEKV
jgi:AraC family transcriptional regulator, regulatory protein of adaptative response / methylated-DNA-[protein]-cysteine methyltransferase